MKKRIISMVLVIVLALSLCVSASAASTTENVAITYRAIKINLNGEEITPCDAAGNTVEPFIMNSNGTTYLPLRAIGQALGLDVAWDGVANTITLSSGGTVKTGTGAAGTTTGTKGVAITYRNIKVFLDGKQLDLVNAKGEKVEPFILNSNSSVYLPLRVVGEALGLEVGWDSSTSTAILTAEADTGAANGISLNQKKIWMFAGDTYQLVATITPDTADNKTVTWTSSDTSVATVSSAGLVTMMKPGVATITATTANGLTAKCDVVVQYVNVTGVTLSDDSISIEPGTTYQLSATVSPDNASSKVISWTSSNTAVATVSANGLVTGKGTGEAVITATCGGISASCKVKVSVREELKRSDIEIKLKIPRNGTMNNYARLEIYNYTDKPLEIPSLLGINGCLCERSPFSGYELPGGYMTTLTYYTFLTHEYEMYLDNNSIGYVVVTWDGQKYYAEYGVDGIVYFREGGAR